MKFSSNIQVIQAQFDGPELKPIYAHGMEDAGCDLKANIPSPIAIEPWKSVWVGTGVHLAMPEGMFALQAQLQSRHHARQRARHHRPRLPR